MKRTCAATLLLLATILCADSAWSAAPTVITFEEFAGGPNLIPNGYFGLNWDNMYHVNGSTEFTNSGYENGAVSGVRTAANGFANPAAITVSGDPFNFFGAYFTAAWNNGLSITVEGYLNGSLDYTSTFQVNAAGPTFFPLNYSNVDELRFSSFGGVNAGLDGIGEHFAMDDFTFGAIPEPSTMLLCLSGLTGYTLLRRSRPRRLT